MMMKHRVRAAWVLAAVMASGSAAARAGALDDRVPQDAILYVGWAGADALGPQYAASNLKGILDASAVQDFVSKQLPKLIAQAGANDPNAPKNIAKLQQGLAAAWRHPTAFYFCPLDYTVPQMPVVRLGLICDAGDDAKPLADLLNEALAQVPQNPLFPRRVVQEGPTVMLILGKADTADDLKKGGGLAAAPTYLAAMNNAKTAAPALSVYVDVARGLATLNEGLAKVPGTPPDVKEKIPAAIQALGVNGLTQIAYTTGFDGKGWTSHMYMGIKGQRTGIVALMDGGPLSESVMAMIPKEAAAFAAWKMDLHKVFTETRAVVGKVDPQTQKDFDAGVASLGQGVGLDVEKDLLAPLGDEWAFYRAPLSDEGGNSPALVHRLKDGDTFAKSLAHLENLYNAMPNAPIKIEKITAAKTEVSTLAFMQYSVAWGVKNDTLYVSSLSGIGGAIKQVENKLPSVLENPDYQAARAALPRNVKPMSISYTNPAKLYPELRRAALGFLPIIRRAGVDVPMELLPEGDDVAKFMTPGAAIVWSDADGIHGAGNSAFPGADLLGGQQAGPAAIGALAGAGAAALPMVVRNRDTTSRNVDLSNLRGISQSALVYAADHKDAMPDDLARLVAEGMVSPKNLVSRRAGTAPLEMTPELEKLSKDDFTKFAAEVAAHSDFVYLGKDTKSEVNAGVIVAYERPGKQTPDGLIVAFQDGHAEFILWSNMPAAFEATNAYLKKFDKPAIDAGGLRRAAGVPDPAMP